MKKLIILFILLGQILWVFNNSILFEKKENLGILSVVEVRGYSGLIKVVYSNFLENLRRIVELGCLVSSLPKGDKGDKEDDTDKKTNNSLIHFCSHFVSFNENVRRLVDNVELNSFIGGQFLISKKSLKILCSCIWLMTFLFLYLFKLKFYFLKPRCSIEHLLVFSRIVMTENPNWDPKGLGPQLGFFYFYYFVLRRRKKCLHINQQ